MKPDTRREVSRDRIFRRLADSALFATYQDAFTQAIGLPLTITPVDDEEQWNHLENTGFNGFCHGLNGGHDSCRECRVLDRCLRVQSREKAHTLTCFAGMKETSVPIRSGGRTLAFLRTGQVFLEPPKAENFSRLRETLENLEYPSTRIAELEGQWKSAPVVSREKYEGAVTILAAFAVQLADLQNQIFLEIEHLEPDLVRTAKQYVNENLEKRIRLDELARISGVSSYYFCKLFKNSTGMTLTEYINRRRIEWAKAKLKDPGARVVEVAFEVGYQSLSQFNRCFRKYVGESPTRFRKRISSRVTAPFMAEARKS